MSLTSKLIAFFLMLAAIAGEQYWVFEQGRKVERVNFISDQAKAIKKALEDQATEYKAIKLREQKETAETALYLNKNNKRLASDLANANKLLKDQTVANTPVPADLISLLNGDTDKSS